MEKYLLKFGILHKYRMSETLHYSIIFMNKSNEIGIAILRVFPHQLSKHDESNIIQIFSAIFVSIIRFSTGIKIWMHTILERYVSNHLCNSIRTRLTSFMYSCVPNKHPCALIVFGKNVTLCSLIRDLCV